MGESFDFQNCDMYPNQQNPGYPPQPQGFPQQGFQNPGMPVHQTLGFQIPGQQVPQIQGNWAKIVKSEFSRQN